MSLFAELQRRSVFKVGAAYLVVGWLVIQVAATLAPQMGLPDWSARFVSLIVMLGFPVALVLAWVFDITPEGLKVDPAPAGNKRMLAIAAVLVAAALGWYWKGASVGGGGAGAARSIAVLPFVNMSGDVANEYFSDGISEEILNVLARTPELSVAARTSSFAFKGKTDDIPQIARELKVRMVLEGSVRKQGERVRITAQLIDAETGFHAWSQTYDRDLKDIFAIQDEIAAAIGNELKVRVGGVSADASVSGTTDLEAHDLYLRGLTLWQMRQGDKLWEAIGLFDQAVAKDPGYAEAYGGIALGYAVLADYSTKISYPQAYGRATDAAEMALAIDPTLAEAYAALGNVAVSERRRATGNALFRRAIALKPSFATAYQWLGTSLLSAGEPVAGLAASERATALDPRSLVVAQNHAIALQAHGRYDEARVVCESVLAFTPNYAPCLGQIAFGELMRDRPEAARPFMERATAAAEPGALPQALRVIEALAGRGDKHAVALEIAAGNSRSYLEPGTTHAFAPSETPWVLVKLGEPKLALDYIDRVLGEDGAVTEWAMVMPAFDPVRCEPRAVALFATLKAKDARFAQVCGAAAAKGAP